jgi:CRP/FNR family transcriptional regulator, cyclic AMP receptor protein
MAKKVAKLPFDPAIFLATVDSGRTLSDYRRNDVIFTQGDPADAVFYIKTGKVKITVISEQGKEAVVAVLGPDEFCGEGCLAGQTRRMATATAMSECEIMRLEKAAIIGVLHDEPGFPEMFVSHLLAAHDPGRGGLGRSIVQFKREALSTGPSFVGKFWQDSRREPVIAKVGQETLAEMIGTTRSGVSFFMNKCRKSGLD